MESTRSRIWQGLVEKGDGLWLGAALASHVDLLILDFELGTANAPYLRVGEELLANHTNLDVIAEKGCISEETATTSLRRKDIKLCTLPRHKQRQQLPKVNERLLNSVRQIIETASGQLAVQFSIERTYSPQLLGLVGPAVCEVDSRHSAYRHQPMAGEA